MLKSIFGTKITERDGNIIAEMFQWNTTIPWKLTAPSVEVNFRL